jgi:hypothetical protein
MLAKCGQISRDYSEKCGLYVPPKLLIKNLMTHIIKTMAAEYSPKH